MVLTKCVTEQVQCSTTAFLWFQPLKLNTCKGKDTLFADLGEGEVSRLRRNEAVWQMLQAGLAAFEPGFELVREQPETQQREEIGPRYCSTLSFKHCIWQTQP